MKSVGKVYLVISLILSVLFYFWGERSYRGYMYNLGVAIVWPVSIFKSYPELDASNPLNFGQSFAQVLASGDSQGRVYFYESFGVLSFYYYAKNDPSVSLAEFTNIQSNPAALRNFTDALLKDEKLINLIANEVDGMTLGDVVRSYENYSEDLEDLLSSNDRKGTEVEIVERSKDSEITKTTKWRSAWAQGINEYISDSSDTSFVIACPDEEGEVKATFSVGGKVFYSHDENSNFDLMIDGEKFQNPLFTDCNVCAGNFPYFWDKFINAQELSVSAGGELYEISVDGLKDTVLPLDNKDNPCRAGF